MNDKAISVQDVVLDYPRKKKGAGFLREILTGRFKKTPVKDRWFRYSFMGDSIINSYRINRHNNIFCSFR